MINTQTEWIESLQEISLLAGTPIKQNNGNWEIVDRKAAWKAIGPRIFDEHLDRFLKIAIEVLREIDPSLELDGSERLTASIRGKALKHSHQLRKGLAETLALLGSSPKPLKSCSRGKPETIAVIAIREIFKGANWLLWASLNNYLSTFAEAAPDAFLDVVETALNQKPCPFVEVFAREKAGVMGENYMTGLLWALETLAWSPEFLQRVTVILGELAAIDPGGNWANRPANSLTEIFLPWYPQTCASIPKRKSAIKALLKEQPAVGWSLLISLLPQTHSSSSGCHKPVWRKFVPEGWSDKVTHAEYWQQVTNYIDLAVDMAVQDLPKLIEFVPHLTNLPKPAFSIIMGHLNSHVVINMPGPDRLPLWEALVDLAERNRRFPATKEAAPSEQMSKIEDVATKLAPKNAQLLYHRLFSKADYELYEDTKNFDEQGKKLSEARQAAVLKILDLGGFKELLNFARQVVYPEAVGNALGCVAWDEADNILLPEHLEAEDKTFNALVRNFVWSKFFTKRWAWADNVFSNKWTNEQRAIFYSFLPFDHDTWKRAELSLGNNVGLYWKKAYIQPYGPQPHLLEAVKMLLQYERPLAALVCLNRLVHENATFSPDIAVQALMESLKEFTSSSGFNHHAILEVIKWLQDNPDTNPDALFKVEWAYLPLLDHHFDRTPKILEGRLASDPKFFCEVIAIVFRPEKRKRKDGQFTEQQKQIAQNAYRLLHGWQMIPGSTSGGVFNGDAFSDWLSKVKHESKASGHFRIAMTHIRQVAAHAPPDPDGLWIHRTVAETLNEKDAGEMRSGFTMRLFNLRRVHGYSAGKEEAALAEGYNQKSEALEENGYYRFATALRGLAKSYERDAEREAERKPFGD